MADRRIEVVNRRTIVTASGAALIAPLIASQVEAKTGPDRAAVEAALLEIQEIASGAPDAPSILNKVDKDTDGSDFTQPAAVRAAIGADLSENVRFQPAGTGIVERSTQTKMREIVSVNDFGALGDGETDDTASINAAILAVALRGGGEVVFAPSTAPYFALGPILIPSNIIVDLKGQTLTGTSWASGTMFASGWLVDGVISSNLGSAAESEIVGYSSVRNGQIHNCERAFHFRNFNFACTINDVSTFSALRFGVFERCFYMSMDNCSARGVSDVDVPRFKFTEQNNLINLRRVSSTSAFSYHLLGGSTGVSFTSCSSEGGVGDAIRFEDECLGIVVEGCYFEGVSGTVFNFASAEACSVSIRNNYINLTDIIIQDGGTLFGSFDASNYIANVGTVAEGVTYRGLLKIDGARNFMSFELPYANDAPQTVPANWVVSKNTRFLQESGATGFGLTDIRARAKHHGTGVVPVCRAGDVGEPLPGFVHFTEVAYPAGSSVTATVTTKIKWQPSSLFAKFVLRILDDTNATDGHVVAGDIFGDFVKQSDSTGKTATISNDGGFLKLSVSGLANAAGNRSLKGSVQLLT